MKQELVNNTKMNAETVTFYVKPEKLNNYTESTTYARCTNIPYSQISIRTYNIRNVDFGIEYRPESAFNLDIEIKEIRLVTSDQETLIKIVFKNALDADEQIQENPVTGRIVREVDLEHSIGFNNLQFICNNDNYALQGFVYINVDDTMLQGCRINVDYELTVKNKSEVDRISINLDKLRYKENIDSSERSNVSAINHTGSATAMRNLKFDTYAIDGTYRKTEKTMTTGNSNYYGKYLGTTYFLGEGVSDEQKEVRESWDTIVDLKIDKILDYIDTNLTFPSAKNKDTDHSWATTTTEALKNGDGQNGSLLNGSLFKDSDGNAMSSLTNLKGVSFETNLSSNLVVSMDDRTSDNQNIETIVNQSLSKFLEPFMTENYDTEKYLGRIVLTTEKLVSSETDTDNLRFENMAEIVQYTSTTGRRTNYDITIGNADIRNGEYMTSLKEVDSSAPEVITLTPPTGLDRRIQNMVMYAVEKNINKVIIAIILFICLITSGFAVPRMVRKYKNKPIK